MTVLAALGAVDWVVLSEDTSQRLIAEILPDLLVKGWRLQARRDCRLCRGDCQRRRGAVLNFEDGCSTSDIIKTIRERG